MILLVSLLDHIFHSMDYETIIQMKSIGAHDAKMGSILPENSIAWEMLSLWLDESVQHLIY